MSSVLQPNPAPPAILRVESRSRFASGARSGRCAGERYLHAMIISYFDDSSDPLRQEYFLAGGLLAGEDQWIEFESDWNEAIKYLKAPFRSTDCETQHGQFTDWGKPDCDALMAQLVSLLVDHRIGGFASVIPVPDFRAVFPQLDKVAPYLLAVEHTLLNVAYLAAKADEQAHVWFELGTAPEDDFMRIYRRLKKLKCWEHRERITNISFADKGMPQLQAADLVAREALKHFQNRGIRPIRKPFDRLQSRVGFLLWNREVLEHIQERNWPDNPAALACWSETDDNPARPDGFYG